MTQTCIILSIGINKFKRIYRYNKNDFTGLGHKCKPVQEPASYLMFRMSHDCIVANMLS